MTNPEGGIPSMASALAGEISKGSIWYVVLGVVLALTGIVLIANPLLGGMALTMLVASLFIVNGGMYLVNAFMARSGGGFLFRVLLGVLTIGVGVWIYTNPDKGLATLTVILAIVIGIAGVLKIMFARALTGVPGVGGLLFSGIVSLVLAVLIFAKLPSASEVVIGVIIGIDMLMSGITMTMIAMKVRSVSNTLT